MPRALRCRYRPLVHELQQASHAPAERWDRAGPGRAGSGHCALTICSRPGYGSERWDERWKAGDDSLIVLEGSNETFGHWLVVMRRAKTRNWRIGVSGLHMFCQMLVMDYDENNTRECLSTMVSIYETSIASGHSVFLRLYERRLLIIHEQFAALPRAGGMPVMRSPSTFTHALLTCYKRTPTLSEHSTTGDRRSLNVKSNKSILLTLTL